MTKWPVVLNFNGIASQPYYHNSNKFLSSNIVSIQEKYDQNNKHTGVFIKKTLSMLHVTGLYRFQYVGLIGVLISFGRSSSRQANDLQI